LINREQCFATTKKNQKWRIECGRETKKRTKYNFIYFIQSEASSL
jgi:hypothetical protein